MLRTYVLAPETVRRFLRRTYWRFQAICGLSFLGFALYMMILSRPVDLQVAGPIVVIIALAYFFIIFFNYRQQLRTLYSARYEIDDSSITYRQVHQQPLHISRANIIQVQEREDGILIETTEPGHGLFIPFGLAREGDSDFQSTLQAWTKYLPTPKKRSVKTWLWVFGLIGSALVLLFANNLWLVLALGIFMLAFGLYAERRLRRFRNIPLGTVRMYSMAFSILMLVILMKACLLGLALLGPR